MPSCNPLLAHNHERNHGGNFDDSQHDHDPRSPQASQHCWSKPDSLGKPSIWRGGSVSDVPAAALLRLGGTYGGMATLLRSALGSLACRHVFGAAGLLESCSSASAKHYRVSSQSWQSDVVVQHVIVMQASRS